MATTNTSANGGASGGEERRQAQHLNPRSQQQRVAGTEDAAAEAAEAPVSRGAPGTRPFSSARTTPPERGEHDYEAASGRVIEMAAPRDRFGHTGSDVPPGPVGQASHPIVRTTSGPAATRRDDPLPHGVQDEAEEHDARSDTTDVFASISQSTAAIAAKLAGVTQDLVEVAHEQASLGNHKAALDLIGRAETLADMAHEVSETSRAASDESVQAMVRRQQEHLLTTQLSTVRGACEELNQAAQHTKELSFESKAATQDLWRQADSGLETLHVAIKERRVQVRLELEALPLVGAAATAAEHLILQAAGAVGGYLQHIWQIVMELAHQALLRLTYVSVQPMLAPLGAPPLPS